MLDAAAKFLHSTAGMWVFKILRAAEWAELQSAGESAGAPVDVSDGFIHFSTAAQVAETLAKHFAGEGDLTLLRLESEAAGDALKWEPSRGGDLFPHLYGPLALRDVHACGAITWHEMGHVLPEGWRDV